MRRYIAPLRECGDRVSDPSRVLENYLPTVIETVNMSIMELEKQSVKKAVDMKRFWKKCILRAVGKVAISEDLYSGATKWKQFCKNITFVAEEAIDRVFKGSKLMPLRRYNFAKAVKQLHVTLMGVISDRKALHLQTDKDPKDYDLLDVMLKTPISQSDTGADIFMSDELVRANLTTILSAGHRCVSCWLEARRGGISSLVNALLTWR
jgi:cytochrome P450